MENVQWYGQGKDQLEIGGARIARGRTLIREGMMRIIRTPLGDYGPDPTFGNAAFLYLHYPLTDGIIAAIVYSSLESIARYEDRVKVNLQDRLPNAFINEAEASINFEIPYQWQDTLEHEILGVAFPLEVQGGVPIGFIP